MAKGSGVRASSDTGAASVERRSCAVAVAASVPGCRQAPEAGPGHDPPGREVRRQEGGGIAGRQKAGRALPRTEWRFDAAAPARPEPPAGAAAGRPPSPAVRRHARLRGGPGHQPGWPSATASSSAGPRTGDAVLHVERTSGLENADQLQAVEIRMRVSAGANLHIVTRPSPTVDLKAEAALPRVPARRHHHPDHRRARHADLHPHAARARDRRAHPPPPDPSHRRRRAPTSRSSPCGSSSAASTWPTSPPA